MANAAEKIEQDVATAPAPPVERTSAIWTRRFVILAFWAVVVCLGLPLWTWTTTIHRSELPLESMNAWAEGRACNFGFPLEISLSASDWNAGLQWQLSHELRNMFMGRDNGRANVSLHYFLVGSEERRNTTALTVRLTNNRLSEALQAKLRTWESVLDIEANLYSADALEDNAAAIIAEQIYHVFRDEEAAMSSLLQNSPFEIPRHQLQSTEQQAKLDARNTRAFKYASTYHVTFSLVTPHGSPSAWDIETALSESIAKLIEPLSAISHFVVNTQVQLFSHFSPSISSPIFDSVNNRWSLQHDDLSGFVNAAEWPLSPSIGSGPTINFILYVPAPEQSPLSIGDGGQTSWIIPQWGGVQIHNMPTNASARLTAADLEADMLIFAEQLTTLLGVPQTPSSLSLRIASLARERTTSLILSASSTLGALARLTLKLTSIAIPDSVAQSVDATLHHLDQACRNVQRGRYQDALAHARIAEAEAEKAFFEPSMVGQVYFPEEHKVAVYVPLLGPMAVPLIMAGLKEIRRLRERKVKTN